MEDSLILISFRKTALSRLPGQTTLLVIASGSLMAVDVLSGNIRFQDGSEFIPDILENPEDPNMASHPDECQVDPEILLWDGLAFETAGTMLSVHFIQPDASTVISEREVMFVE